MEDKSLHVEEPLSAVRYGQHYTHFKGGRYIALLPAVHSEDNTILVIYESVLTHQVFARPLESFIAQVTYPDGSKGPRFVCDVPEKE